MSMESHTTRRTFLRHAAAGCGVAGLGSVWGLPVAHGAASTVPPSYLVRYRDSYASDPRGAALRWFRDAKFGLFLHYGLYSNVGKGEWVQYWDKIPVAEYERLSERFTADKFDADFIADLAVDAGMKYVNITSKHHDGFCLFKTDVDGFHSVNSPAKRDLIAELAEACRKRELGLCLYYTHGREWRHPHAPNNGDWGGHARPEYEPPEPRYAYGEDHNLQEYLDVVKHQVTELLTNYGPIAAIWLDGVATPMSRPEKLHRFQLQDLYDHIHAQQPQVLVSYKQGVTGTEDFMAPERHWKEQVSNPLELCDTLQPNAWGYQREVNGSHRKLQDVVKMREQADRIGANLLLNTGPLGDGSIHPEDVQTLRAYGQHALEQ